MRLDDICTYPLELHCALLWGGQLERDLLTSFLALFSVLPAAPLSCHVQANVVGRQSWVQETVVGCFVKLTTECGRAFVD